jgi:hypothetical protein
MQAKGIVFYSVARDSCAGSGTRGRFSFDGASTTVAALARDLAGKLSVDLKRMSIEVRPVDSSPAVAGADLKPALAHDAPLRNYANVDVRVVRHTAEHEEAKKTAALGALEASLFGSQAYSASIAARMPAANKRDATLPRPTQLAALELVDLPLRKGANDVEHAASKHVCLLCDEAYPAAAAGTAGRCAQSCARGCCSTCYEYCLRQTAPKCPVCNGATKKGDEDEPALKQHRTEG